tara:strand:+ start:706 stop:822 length:117 start_codon:yes stop_codon:yes gene_type:complete
MAALADAKLLPPPPLVDEELDGEKLADVPYPYGMIKLL